MHGFKTLILALGLVAPSLANPVPDCSSANTGDSGDSGNSATNTGNTGNTGNSGNSGNSATVSAAVVQNVTDQIKLWQNAIDTVNNFVDTVLTVNDPDTISKMAVTAFAAAQEEATSNSVLSSGQIDLDASGLAATKALPAAFDIIGPAINDTIANPGNVKANVAAVNGQRCAPPLGKNGISIENDVQQAAASAVGISVPPAQTATVCTAAAAA